MGDIKVNSNLDWNTINKDFLAVFKNAAQNSIDTTPFEKEIEALKAENSALTKEVNKLKQELKEKENHQCPKPTNDQFNNNIGVITGKVPTEKGVSFIMQDNYLPKGESMTTYGVRLEKEIEAYEKKWFKLNVIGANDFNFNKNSFNMEPGIGVKAQASINKNVSVYTSALGTVNFGVLDGKFSGGIGAKGAVGAEFGPAYAEYFGDISTNKISHGFALGLRAKF